MAIAYSFTSPEEAYAVAEHQIGKNYADGSGVLDFTGFGLTNLPKSLEMLVNLHSLDLSYNQLTSLPESLGQLSNLQTLSLSSNQLTSLPESLGQLSNLQTLSLSSNQLTSLPESLGQLSNLQTLNLASNQLTSLPDNICKIRNLGSLNLFNNQLHSLPDFFSHFPHLWRMTVADNPIESLPESIMLLASLNWLDCEGCRLKHISLRILDAIEKGDLITPGNEHGFLLHGNIQLGLPPEILGPSFDEVSSKRSIHARGQWVEYQDPKRIARYLRQIQGGTAPRLNEAKLLVVGPGGAGKSSIIEQLVDHTFTRGKLSTHGVVVRDWEICERDGEPVTLNIWDFGGQELQHSTHEFFMTERSVYLLVFNPREDQSAQSILYYWLELIRMIAPDAPIIVALSRQDEFRGHLNDAQELMRTFNIIDFVRLSCDENDEAYCNFEMLRSLIKSQLLKLDHVSNRLPPAWMAVKQELVDTNENYLAYGDYQTLCEKHNIKDTEDQELLARFLNDLGTMLNYADRIPLEQTNILNPRWVTEGVYALVLCQELREAKGILQETLVARLEMLVEQMLRDDGRLKDDETYTRRYPRHTHRFILEMMKVFLLCHELPRQPGHGARYLVPNALPEDEPEDIKQPPDDALRFELHYPRLLPTSVISLFMVYMEAHPDNATLWRQGIGGQCNGHDYLVTLHDREQKIRVAVWGHPENRTKTLDHIRLQLTRANQIKKRLDPVGWVPLPDDPQAGIRYDLLVKLEEKGVKRYPVEGSNGDLREIVVLDLLRGIGEEHIRLRRQFTHGGISESDFEAICKGLFPGVFGQFTETMSYAQKVQLLIETAHKGAWLERVEEILRQGKGVSGNRSGVEWELIMDKLKATDSDREEKPTNKPEIIGYSGATFNPQDCWKLLHISDLHFTGSVEPKTKLQWLLDDLRSLKVDKLDFVVISGDFTDKGKNEGFSRAAAFVKDLCQQFDVELKSNCLVVPGNHDVQDLHAAYDYVRKIPEGTPDGHVYEEGRGFLVRNPIEHRKRFLPFSNKFYRPLFGQVYPRDPAKQGMVRTFAEAGLQFWLLNSAWELDEFDRDRATIHQTALANVIRQANEQDVDQKMLRIGVWHHAVQAPLPDKPLRDPSFLKSHLQKNGVKLALHGDVHRMEQDWIGYWHRASSIHIVGVGSFASPDEGIEHATPRLYNLMLFKKNLSAVRIHTRAQAKEDEAWEGWAKWPSRETPESEARFPFFDIDLV